MVEVLVWWLVVEIVGLAVLPLAWRLFAALPDRGYAFAKPLGILLIAYILWLLALSGVAANSSETVFFILAVLAVVSWLWALRPAVASQAAIEGTAGKTRRRSAATGMFVSSSTSADGRPEIMAWLRANIRLVAVEEIVFLVALLVWALFKAYNPEIVATEKPMELAFLNGILRSGQFPPLDPWLSGFSISYYYMGYLAAAVLTRLAGLASSITFNLTLVLSFALTLTGAFSIVYNLVAHRLQPSAGRLARSAVTAGLLAAFFVGIMGNLEGFLEFFYVRGLGSPAFWQAVGIADLDKPYVSTAWYPTANWWWWKASRVIGTQGAIGDYTINEFPFFSFMLGDNHPHVLALPYVLMALGLALSLLFGPVKNLVGLLGEHRFPQLLGATLAPALLLGGLFFLNSWDFPVYLVIAVGAYALCVYRQQEQLDSAAVKEMLAFAVPVVIMGVLLYLPFYAFLKSQVQGIGIVRVRSQLHHYLIIFGPFLLMALGFLAVKVKEWRNLPAEERSAARTFVLPLLALGVVVGIVMIVLQVWTTVTTLMFASLLGVLVSLMLVAIILLTIFVLVAHVRGDASDVFALLLLFVGCSVTLAPEWLYIKDTFGGNLSRMNTVFKLQYQGWILLALAAAYSLHYVLTTLPAGRRLSFSVPRVVYAIATVLIIAAASFYPVMAFYTKADQFMGSPNLDGTAYMKTSNPDDYKAIQWLAANVQGAPTIVEAVGGEYSEYARFSTHTGLPTILGWPGHEVQWRGNAQGWEAREGDVNHIYATTDVNEAKNLLRKYGVTYVIVGRLERGATGADGKAKYDQTALGKFATFMDAVYAQGGTTVYRVRE